MKPLLASTCLLAVCLSALLVVQGCQQSDKPAEKDGLLKTEADFRDKVAELRRDKKRIENAIDRLSREKQKTIAFLKEKGVTSSSKITDDSEIKYALSNLVAWKAEIQKYQGQVTRYDDAINSIMAMLDKLERDRINNDVGLTDDQRVELQAIVINLQDRLDIQEDNVLQRLEWAEALDEEDLEDKVSKGDGEPSEANADSIKSKD